MVFTHTIIQELILLTGFNVGCVDEIDSFKLKNISIADGKNHPLDKKNNLIKLDDK